MYKGVFILPVYRMSIVAPYTRIQYVYTLINIKQYCNFAGEVDRDPSSSTGLRFKAIQIGARWMGMCNTSSFNIFSLQRELLERGL